MDMDFAYLLHDPDVLAALAGIGAFTVVVLIWSALVDADPLTARLKSVTDRRRELNDEVTKKQKVSRRERLVGASTLHELAQKLKLEQGKQTAGLRLKLARAGYHSPEALALYLLLRLGLPIAFGFLAFFLLFITEAFDLEPMMKIMAMIVAVLAGLGSPDLFLKNMSQRRTDVLRKAMPDALDLMVICAEAGLSLDSSLDRVSREMAPSCPELAEEIGLTSVELSFLPNRSQALQNLADRVPVSGVLGLVNTLIQTEKYGTPLAQALRVLSGEMRTERIMAAEAKAAKLPATLTVPMILFILPPLFVVLLGPAILRVSALMH